jgi:hypothetical protein
LFSLFLVVAETKTVRYCLSSKANNDRERARRDHKFAGSVTNPKKESIIMAPDGKQLSVLMYENEDVEHLSAFERKGMCVFVCASKSTSQSLLFFGARC